MFQYFYTMIKNIFARIWALWTALAFVGTMLIFFIPFLLFVYPLRDPKRNIRFLKFARVWMGVFLPLCGCPMRIRGSHHFAKGENYIVCCNHNSFMDIPVSSPAIPGGNKTIAKTGFAKVPLFGLIYKTGSVLVDRKSESSRKNSFIEMRKVLQMGLHMCIYPEGTRNRTDQPLKTFHDGAFKLAVDTRKAIIPALIFHTRKIMPAHKTFYVFPHPIDIHFLAPIPVEQNDTHETLKQRVFNIMTEYYSKNGELRMES